MKYNLLQIFLVLILGACTKSGTEELVDYVNPLIGTAPSTTISALKHGEGTENNAQVIPAVTVPFGMTNWTPQSRSGETKCVAPYYYKDSVINGFRGSHWLSGSCVQDYGSMTLMPVTGSLVCKPELRGSAYDHQKEIATPYEYRTFLTDYNIQAAMSATKRCGFIRFTVDKDSVMHIIINPNSDEGQGYIKIIPERNEIIAYNPVHRIYQGWGEPAGFSGYFVVKFKQAFMDWGVYSGDLILEKQTVIEKQNNLGAFISFNSKKGDVFDIVIGTSFTSIEQARKNLDAEIGNKSYEDIKSELKNTWETILNKVRVEGSSEEDKVKFYTALYHSFLQPRTFNDVDGSYPGFAGGEAIMNSGERDYYVDFSMWDTYRALHPLLNMLMPKENADMMYSLLDKAKQGNWMPIFPCWNSYTSAMIGDHAIATVADAYIKGSIDLSLDDYKYLKKNAYQSPEDFKDYENGKGRRALESYLKYGFVPLEDEVAESFHQKEQVSRTLEYAFDDFALSKIAYGMNDSVIARDLENRSLNYTNVYSSADECVRGRYSNGDFTDEFDKFQRMPYITEGTPWQYTWYVPHDVKGLVNLMGGDQQFSQNLDNFFASGQYWHGNEPGHQIPFLYNYCGQPWKTQEIVANIMNEEYGFEVGGLSGNDDAGQMSAWYVFAALGFYPVCPSVPEYVISGPKFDKVTLHLDSGEKLVIKANGVSSGKTYIHGLKIGGKEVTKNVLSHQDIVNGGNIVFKMDSVPNMTWGIDTKDRPYSISGKN